MKTHYQNRAGFTLIEVIAVLVLTSIVLAFSAMLLVTSTEVFISNKNASEDSQKIQIAMNRLVKELTYASVSSPMAVSDTGLSVQWTSSHPDRFGELQVASWNGTAGADLILQGAVLMDNVSLFSATAGTDSITISLRSTRSPGVTHTTVVHPRYE